MDERKLFCYRRHVEKKPQSRYITVFSLILWRLSVERRWRPTTQPQALPAPDGAFTNANRPRGNAAPLICIEVGINTSRKRAFQVSIDWPEKNNSAHSLTHEHNNVEMKVKPHCSHVWRPRQLLSGYRVPRPAN